MATLGDKDVNALMAASSPAKRLLLKFDAIAPERLAAREAERRRGPETFVKWVRGGGGC